MFWITFLVLCVYAWMGLCSVVLEMECCVAKTIDGAMHVRYHFGSSIFPCGMF